MRSFAAACVCAAILAGIARAQDPQILVETYAGNFQRGATSETKLTVVRDAVSLRASGLGPFYHEVVRHVVREVDALSTDSRLQEMALLAIAEIGEESYKPALDSVWDLCRRAAAPEIRIAALATLARIGKGDPRTAGEMTALLDAQNRLVASGKRVDSQLALTLVRTLGEVADPIAARALFTARSLPYPPAVADAANEALLALDGDMRGTLVQIVESGTAAEKEAALVLALRSEALDRSGRAAVAAAALKTGLAAAPSDAEGQRIARQMRAAAVRALARDGWPQGVDLGLEHFGRAVAESGRGLVDSAYVVEAVRALGESGRHEAAERLALYLELVNSYAERRQPYDETVLLAVIDTLGRLGDPIAFANLSYAKYMPYSARVQAAIRQAVAALKW